MRLGLVYKQLFGVLSEMLDELRALCLFVFLVFSLPISFAQGTNKYYSSPGNALGVCTVASCSPTCPANQYLLGCTFNS